MWKKYSRLTEALVAWRWVSVLLLALPALAVNADEERDLSGIWDIARGGQLYDSWFAVLGTSPPPGNHPAYPAGGAKKGALTWRCKECHGRDYRGSAGAYAQGPHYTGIRGIQGMMGANPQRILATIRDATHHYTTEMIPLPEMKKLALFVSLGQWDARPFVDADTKTSLGEATDGEAYYKTICAACHGPDGKKAIAPDPEEPYEVNLGSLASVNPWETFHKVRFGQPGLPMIAMITLSKERIADIVAYLQTLPRE